MYIYSLNTILLLYHMSQPQKLFSPEGIYKKKYKFCLQLILLKKKKKKILSDSRSLTVKIDLVIVISLFHSKFKHTNSWFLPCQKIKMLQLILEVSIIQDNFSINIKRKKHVYFFHKLTLGPECSGDHNFLGPLT